MASSPPTRARRSRMPASPRPTRLPGLHRVLVEPDTIVPDFEREPVGVSLQYHMGATSMRMLHSIVQSLLSHPVKSQFQIFGQTLARAARNLQGDVHRTGCVQFVYTLTQSRFQSLLI